MTTLSKYADLLTSYCIAIQKGDKVLIRSTTAAEPLVQALYQVLIQKGAYVETSLKIEDQDHIFYKEASSDQLDHVSEFYSGAIDTFDVVYNILAPHNLKSTYTVDSASKMQHQKAMASVKKKFMERSAKGELKWCLCVYPTSCESQAANMSKTEFADFVYRSCFLFDENPSASWQAYSDAQQHIVDYLNKRETIRYSAGKTDITFSTKGRIWINSDGRRNMPSGEVFTSPVEESVNGTVYFSCPTVYEGKDVQGITLTVENGIIQTWSAEIGQDVLDRVFAIEGARMFGEVAIGTNYAISHITKNILFDEKIGGTIHMAVGASYPETGGKNTSAVHWDMITDMSSGTIYADDVAIYKNGQFTIPEASTLRQLFTK